MARMRHANVTHELRTDLNHVQMKARSLQKQISTTIQEVSEPILIPTYSNFKLH